MLTKTLLTICSLLFAISLSFAQSKLPYSTTTSNYKLSAEEFIQLYNKNKFKEFGYINGKEYSNYHNPNHSNPLYNSKSGIGTIYIGGHMYPDLILNYDIHTDEIINIAKQLSLSKHFINLNKMLVDSFTICHDKKCITLHNLSFNDRGNKYIDDGYYEIWNFNNMNLYFKHIAPLVISEGYDEYRYELLKYIQIGDHFYSIKSRNKILKLFPDHKKELKKFINILQTNYRNLSKDQIISILRFTESLKLN